MAHCEKPYYSNHCNEVNLKTALFQVCLLTIKVIGNNSLTKLLHKSQSTILKPALSKGLRCLYARAFLVLYISWAMV